MTADYRERMIEDMKLRDLRPRTQEAYLQVVKQLVEHFGRPPEALTEDELRDYFLYLRDQRKLAPSTVNQALYGVRFLFEQVAPLLRAGVNQATIVGRAGSDELRGSGEITVTAIAAELKITPRTIERRSSGEDVLARVLFPQGVSARDASVSSIGLNDVVAVERVVSIHGRELQLKFDRAAVIGILPIGQAVEVRVTGTLRGLPFVAVDHVRVIE